METNFAPLYERIHAAFPNTDFCNAMTNSDGMMNAVVIVEGRVHRFARNDHSIKTLDEEIAAMELIRPYVTLPFPQFTRLDRDYVVYPYIKGDPLFRDDILSLPDADQDAIAEQLATFLRQLHTIPRDVCETAGLPVSEPNSKLWTTLLDTFRRELFPLMISTTKTWVERHFAPVLKDANFLHYEPALIHDDLAPYHILYNANIRRIVGVIDFGTMYLSDPARDYAMLINLYGETVVRRMAKFDDRIAPLIDRARFYAGLYELEWVLGGVRAVRNTVPTIPNWTLENYTVSLDRARDMMPYGSAL